MGWWSRLFENKGPAPQAMEPTLAPPPPPPLQPPAAPPPEPPPAPDGHPPIVPPSVRDLREDTPEFDESVARHELQAGTHLPQGAKHLANLLLVDPLHPRWRGLLDGYVAAAGSSLDTLVPDVDPRHASTEALRAWIWQLQGRPADAVSRLVDVARALGEPALLHAWALDWLEPEGAIESLPEPIGLKLFGALLTLSAEASAASARQLSSLRRWSDLLERAAPAWDDTGLLLTMRAGLMRKAGRFDAALALAGGLADATGFDRIAEIGLALRAKGQFAESALAFEHGARGEPDNTAAFLEAGDSWIEAACWPQALAAYEAALALEPGHDWAAPSAWYCHWKSDGGTAWHERLGAAATQGNARAHALLFRELGAIAEPRDAAATALRQRRAGAPQPGSPSGLAPLTVGTLEAPSARLAIELELAALGRDPRFELAYGSVAREDPRVAVAEVAHTLWHYDGLRATPALRAPDPATTALIAGLASQRYHPHENWAQASHVAARLGAGAAAQVLAVMVNPPPVPAATHALAWLPRVQLAAAMVAGQIDDGWQGSQRRAALHSLLFGPADWATTAGIRVLGAIARAEPAHAQDIHRMFEQRERHLPSEGHWDWVAQLYVEWQTLPWLSGAERAVFKARLDALD